MSEDTGNADQSEQQRLDQRRLEAARFAWKHRNQYCEKPHEFPDGRRERITWGQWFEITFGLTLDAFKAQQQQKGK